MRFSSLVFVATVFLVAVVSPSSAQLKKVRFSVSAASIAEVPFRIANIKGFYRDEGLDVEVILIRGAVGMQALWLTRGSPRGDLRSLLELDARLRAGVGEA